MSRLGITRTRAVRGLSVAVLGLVALAPAASGSRAGADAADRWNAAPSPTAVVGYRSQAALARVLRLHPGLVLRRIPALGVAEILPRAKPQFFANATADLRGIDYVEPPVARMDDSEPALAPSAANLPGGVLEWQYAAARMDAVPSSVLRAASAITIGVVDTGADVTAPDISAKAPLTHSVVNGGQAVRDAIGHGTFVAALAAGSITNNDGIAGFGGDARLMIVQASATQGAFSDFDEAAAIVWAVDHGARILNLSLGGPDTSTTERKAIDYAVAHGALIVAAVGNEHDQANPVEYPAALVQPVGSDGRGGTGLSVGASDTDGNRAPFSNTGSHLSLVAPGVNVLSALSTVGANIGYVKVPVPGATGGIYAFGSGTSFAAPEVSGAAALVWAANPALTAQQVAQILKETASNRGGWNNELGYGVIDVAAAVARASGRQESGGAVPSRSAAQLTLQGAADGGRIRLTWIGTAAERVLALGARRDGPDPHRAPFDKADIGRVRGPRGSHLRICRRGARCRRRPHGRVEHGHGRRVRSEGGSDADLVAGGRGRSPHRRPHSVPHTTRRIGAGRRPQNPDRGLRRRQMAGGGRRDHERGRAGNLEVLARPGHLPRPGPLLGSARPGRRREPDGFGPSELGLRRARCARRVRAGARRSARSPCRSGVRRRSSTGRPRRGRRAASPFPPGCQGSPCAARRAVPGR